MGNVYCGGNESVLQHCSYSNNSNANSCNRSEAAGARCICNPDNVDCKPTTTTTAKTTTTSTATTTADIMLPKEIFCYGDEPAIFECNSTAWPEDTCDQFVAVLCDAPPTMAVTATTLSPCYSTNYKLHLTPEAILSFFFIQSPALALAVLGTINSNGLNSKLKALLLCFVPFFLIQILPDLVDLFHSARDNMFVRGIKCIFGKGIKNLVLVITNIVYS